MSGGKYFQCIHIYSALDIVVSKKKSFRSQEINLSPRRASEIVPLKSSFYPKGDASGNDTSYGYSSLSPPTMNIIIDGSDFIGW